MFDAHGDLKNDLRALFGHNLSTASTLVLMYGQDGAVQWASDAFLRLLGYTRREFDRGSIDWDQMTPPEYWTLEDSCIGQIKEQGVVCCYVKELVRKDGERIAVRVQAAQSASQDELIVALVHELIERPGS
jgi:PAS domain S-box-containing protein